MLKVRFSYSKKERITDLFLVISCKNLKPCDSNGLRYQQNFFITKTD
jgi:hypothetical protein